MPKPKHIIALGLVLNFSLIGCTSFSNKMNGWVGQPIETWLAIADKGRERLESVAGPDARGRTVYTIYLEKRCSYSWIVDAKGIITGWESKGSGCKGYWN